MHAARNNNKKMIIFFIKVSTVEEVTRTLYKPETEKEEDIKQNGKQCKVVQTKTSTIQDSLKKSVFEGRYPCREICSKSHKDFLNCFKRVPQIFWVLEVQSIDQPKDVGKSCWQVGEVLKDDGFFHNNSKVHYIYSR